MSSLRDARSLAYRLGRMLDTVLADEPSRFPVDVSHLAREYTAQCYPNDPIVFVEGDDLPEFDGALVRTPKHQKWGIVYSNSVHSKGRIRFTLAHELGHYLLHRREFPDGFSCDTLDSSQETQDQYGRIEREADEFAAHLLMPMYDFCEHLSLSDWPSFDKLSVCATRYGVSLTAAVIHWINHTRLRSVVVVSRDGYILWSRSSKSAMKTLTFFRSVGLRPVAVPEQSLATRQNVRMNRSVGHEAGIWFDEPCEELVLFSDHYGTVISILILDHREGIDKLEEEPIRDGYDDLTERTPGSSWLG